MFFLNLLFLFLSLNCIYISPVNSGNLRIVGGEYSKPGEIKFLVSVQEISPNVHVCGGVIYSLKHIFTAAHCIADLKLSKPKKLVKKDPSKHRVVAGSIYIRNGFGESVRTIETWIFHPKTDMSPIGFWIFDLALIILESELDKNVNIRSAPLQAHSTALMEEAKTLLMNSVSQYYCKIAGWGKTKSWFNSSENKYIYSQASPTMKDMQARIIDSSMCKKTICSYKKSMCSVDLDELNMLCVVAVNVGESPCIGDTGGPLICLDKVWALGSYGFACGEKDLPAMYTLISSMLDVANAAMKSNAPVQSLQVHHAHQFISILLFISSVFYSL